jgi:hypothetical protein
VTEIALLHFKQPVPKSGQIELNSVVEQYFLATTQIGERSRVKTAGVDSYFLGCGPEIRLARVSVSPKVVVMPRISNSGLRSASASSQRRSRWPGFVRRMN